MSEDFVVKATSRTAQGTSASRRLRREGKVPTILYGGGVAPQMLAVDQNELLHHLDHEAFYSHILKVEVDGEQQQAVLKDVQRHPSKPRLLHMDLMRIVAGQKIRMTVPLHFTGEKLAPGIKDEGGVLDRVRSELEIECLPKDLPEFIEVDVSGLSLNESIHLEELTLPEGIISIALMHEENWTVCAVHMPRALVEETDEDEDEVAADEVEATEQGDGEDGEGDDSGDDDKS
ncbi:50S ribosomal protein L25/general stress protein Ctc [bacterium]|nr:50S ribosomal protein L25/general stress protein Ctc [bacterium]